MPAPPAVTVVVPARDAAPTIGATLDAVAAQRDAPAHEVIVVDNGSRDETPALAEAHPLAPRVIRRPRGEGPGAARNDGARAGTGAVIAFTDSDCAPTPGWLAAGIGALERTGVDILQGAVLPQPGVPVHPFDRTLAVVSEYGLYETANLFLRRPWFDRVGGFVDVVDAGRPFGEDAVMVWRARRAGARTGFAAEALVHHAVFDGTAADYLSERARDGLFADLALHIPELREAFFHRRYFLNRRSAAFDLALGGVALAALRRSPVPLVAAWPWLRLVSGDAAHRAGQGAYGVAAVLARGDALSFTSLVRGSVRARRLLI